MLLVQIMNTKLMSRHLLWSSTFTTAPCITKWFISVSVVVHTRNCSRQRQQEQNGYPLSMLNQFSVPLTLCMGVWRDSQVGSSCCVCHILASFTVSLCKFFHTLCSQSKKRVGFHVFGFCVSPKELRAWQGTPTACLPQPDPFPRCSSCGKHLS